MPKFGTPPAIPHISACSRMRVACVECAAAVLRQTGSRPLPKNVATLYNVNLSLQILNCVTRDVDPVSSVLTKQIAASFGYLTRVNLFFIESLCPERNES